MIEFQQGDILDADVEALVNTVNCVGIMGRGIALQFRKEFPENFKAYESACQRGEVQPGKMFVFPLQTLQNPRYIINFPTKRHWKGKSKIEDIKAGLRSLVEDVRRLKIRSIAIPPLGCGLGGLRWSEVRPLIEDTFLPLSEVQVQLFAPTGAPAADQMAVSRKAPDMTIGRAALLGLMRRYLAAVMDPFVSLLEIHKLMYFMQESGEGLRLRFKKGPYGPYSENLRHVLNAIEGHFISGYGDAEDNPTKQIEMLESGSAQSETMLEAHAETQRRFAAVGELIDGFETPYGMELLATVHWVAKNEDASTPSAAIEKVHAWSERKRMFPPQHIELAWNVLSEKAWLKPTARRAVRRLKREDGHE